MLEDSPAYADCLQRNTFRKAVSVEQIDDYLRRRLRLGPKSDDGVFVDDSKPPPAPIYESLATTFLMDSLAE